MITERIDNITKIPPRYRVEAPPVPKSVKIELTGRCNYQCGYCPLVKRKGKAIDMDFSLFKRITREMIELGVSEVGVFYMGESFTNNKLLIDAITYLKKELETEYVFLTSNASLADKETVDRCMDAGLDSLKWSCNISDRYQFKKIVGVKESLFDDALNNIRDAWIVREECGHKTKLYASSIMYDDDQPERMNHILRRIIPYVDQHYWLPLYSMGSLARTGEADLGLTPIAGNPGRYGNPVSPIPCWVLFTASHVMADGRVSGCASDVNGDGVMGDLRTQSFMEIWHAEKYKELRSAHLSGDITGTKCEHCAICGT